MSIAKADENHVKDAQRLATNKYLQKKVLRSHRNGRNEEDINTHALQVIRYPARMVN